MGTMVGPTRERAGLGRRHIMTPHALTLCRAALRSVRLVLDGSVRFPQGRLGDILEGPDSDAFVVYRETALVGNDDDAPERVVLVFAMQVTGRDVGETVRDVLFDPLANVATPFFVGMPGFRRKLWLAGERPGAFLELYEWASRADAERFVDVLESLLAPFEFAGSASFEVVDDDSIDAYVDARAVEWRDAARAGRPGRLGSLRPLVLVGIALAVVGYRYWRRRSRAEPSPVGVE
jgi:hypothetical protein